MKNFLQLLDAAGQILLAKFCYHGTKSRSGIFVSNRKDALILDAEKMYTINAEKCLSIVAFNNELSAL